MSGKVLAIIPARGGSKRIPGKNIKKFCGKPIIAYSIEAAKESGVFDEIMVSTDSEEIADIARTLGASVPFMRSAETAGDFASTKDVLLEVFREYEKKGQLFEQACCIYPTAPFVTGEGLRESRKMLEKEGVAMVNPIVQFSFPPQRGLSVNEDGIIEVLHMENRFVRSQDMEPVYHDAGQFYWYDVRAFLRNDGIMDGLSAAYILDDLHVQDIDNETDWEIAEMKYEILKRKGLL
ncbi:MAG: pseudaminic acid cytidylyltransferase [Clostridiales bacterium]|nr:pseudaminic acid cytidylyltransferase [Clostridiales bacterium]